MGINDRDYMSGAKRKEEVIDVNQILIILGKFVVILVALAFSCRFPILMVKIPVALLVLFLGWRWIRRTLKKQKKSTPRQNIGPSDAPVTQKPSAIERYEEAVRNSPRPDRNVVQLLIAYDAAGQYGKAKALIQSLDGEELPQRVAEELAVLAKNYFPVALERSESGSRFRLV